MTRVYDTDRPSVEEARRAVAYCRARRDLCPSREERGLWNERLEEALVRLEQAEARELAR